MTARITTPPTCFRCRHTTQHSTCACCILHKVPTRRPAGGSDRVGSRHPTMRVSPPTVDPVGNPTVNWWYAAAAVSALVTLWGAAHGWHTTPVDTIVAATLTGALITAGALR